MSPTRSRHDLVEAAKLGLRRALGKADLSISRDPYSHRVTRALAHHGIDTVIDVGANVGQYAALLRAGGYRGQIVSVEPLDSAFAALSARAAKDPRWTALQNGVGEAPGTIDINISANSYSSSVLDINDAHLDAAPDSRYVGTQQIELTTVAHLVDQQGIDPARCLLKVDTQGYESQVLAGAEPVLGKIAAVQLELSFVELYAGQALFDDHVAALRGHGFELWSLDPGISGSDGRMLQCDGLFMRPGGTA